VAVGASLAAVVGAPPSPVTRLPESFEQAAIVATASAMPIPPKVRRIVLLLSFTLSFVMSRGTGAAGAAP
jgi:hypothetical protein